MVQEIRSLQKLAIFFQGLTLGAEGGGGGLVRGTLRYKGKQPSGVPAYKNETSPSY